MDAPGPKIPRSAEIEQQVASLVAATSAREPAALARYRVLPSVAACDDATLARLAFTHYDACSVVAREHGFPSWSALRATAVDAVGRTDLAALAEAIDGGNFDRIDRFLAEHPGFTAENFHAAIALGDMEATRAHLAQKPTLATERGGPHDWEPILYVAHSRWAQRDSAGLVAVARLLLTHGADPNASYPWEGNPKMKLPALWAASCHARHLELARVLLEAGAKPDDGESVYHAAEHGDLPMLDLLARHGAHADGGAGAVPWHNTPLYFILGHYAGLANDPGVRRGVAWLLAHGANPNHVCYPDKQAETPLHLAARHWDGAMIDLLVKHGADIEARRGDGRTALSLAETHGRLSAAAALRTHNARDELTPEDRFVAACLRGDRAEALRLREPAFVTAHARVLLDVPTHPTTAALETMLACGFDVATTGGMGETALHWAAFTGNLPAVQVLLAQGASPALRDTTHHAPPLGWCFHASQQPRPPHSDFPGVARALIAAGSPFIDGPGCAADDVLDAASEAQRNRPLPGTV